jgi:hypothetical protein
MRQGVVTELNSQAAIFMTKILRAATPLDDAET